MPITDGFNHVVPERLQYEFACRQPILKIVDQLESIRSYVRVLKDQPGAQCIDTDAISKHLAAICVELRYGIPFCECDCSAFQRCEKCGEKRWLTAREVMKHQPSLVAPSSTRP